REVFVTGLILIEIQTAREKLQTRQGIGVQTADRTIVGFLIDEVQIGVRRQVIVQEFLGLPEIEDMTDERSGRLDTLAGRVAIREIRLCLLGTTRKTYRGYFGETRLEIRLDMIGRIHHR